MNQQKDSKLIKELRELNWGLKLMHAPGSGYLVLPQLICSSELGVVFLEMSDDCLLNYHARASS